MVKNPSVFPIRKPDIRRRCNLMYGSIACACKGLPFAGFQGPNALTQAWPAPVIKFLGKYVRLTLFRDNLGLSGPRRLTLVGG